MSPVRPHDPSSFVNSNSSKIIVTAALPYANGQIHIGHLLEYVQADIYTRFLRLIGKNVLYICASDMHGTPVEVNAAKAGKAPEQFATEFWQEHQKDFASYVTNHFESFENFLRDVSLVKNFKGGIKFTEIHHRSSKF